MKVNKLPVVVDGQSFALSGVDESIDLVLYFGGPSAIKDSENFQKLRESYPKAVVSRCSGGGVINYDVFSETDLTGIAIDFDSTSVRFSGHTIADESESGRIADSVYEQLKASDLRGILVLADGLNFNGTLFTRTLREKCGKNVPIIGGMASDGAAFKETWVCANDIPGTKRVACIGFYGTNTRILTGSDGGWSKFGPDRTITRAEGNVLYEMDGEPALALYKRYLGYEAKNLPASGLLFPLSIYQEDAPNHALTRTIIGIDEEKQSLIFAGDIPQGWKTRLMTSSNDELCEGAENAAKATRYNHEAGFAVGVSCIGRRLFMDDSVESEIAAVNSVFGGKLPFIGFYSNGEICPHGDSGFSDLHNQTMTLSVFQEG
jgi:hypothetical protein